MTEAKPKKLYGMLIVHPDGREELKTSKKAFDYREIQAAVGGYFQEVGYFKKWNTIRASVVYANEEGLLKGLPFNAKASRAWRNQYPHATQLVGSIAIMHRVAPSDAAMTLIAQADL